MYELISNYTHKQTMHVIYYYVGVPLCADEGKRTTNNDCIAIHTGDGSEFIQFRHIKNQNINSKYFGWYLKICNCLEPFVASMVVLISIEQFNSEPM